MRTETIAVPEIHCDHCRTSIEGVLRTLDGVSEAAVDVDQRTVSVTLDDAAITRDALVSAIEDQGYEVPATA